MELGSVTHHKNTILNRPYSGALCGALCGPHRASTASRGLRAVLPVPRALSAPPKTHGCAQRAQGRAARIYVRKEEEWKEVAGAIG